MEVFQSAFPGISNAWARSHASPQSAALRSLRAALDRLGSEGHSPAADSIEGRSLESLARESDPRMLAEGILYLGRRAAARNDAARAQEYLSLLAYPSSELGSAIAPQISQAARAELAALGGEGPLGPRVEILSRNLVEQATDPALLVGMGAAHWIGSAVRLGALSRLLASPQNRFWNRAWGARLTAAGAAFVPEVGALWAGSRGVQTLFQGRTLPWDGASLTREWLSLTLTFGAIRLSGGIFGSLTRSPVSSWRAQALHQAGLFGGIALGHWTEARLGLRPAQSADGLWIDSLATLLQFHVSRRLLNSLSGRGLNAFVQEGELRSRHLAPASLRQAWEGLFQAQGITASGLRLPLPETRERSPLAPAPVLMAANVHGGGGPGGRAPVSEAQLLIRESISRIRWVRVALENQIRTLDSEFFSEEAGPELPSRTPRWNAADNPRIDLQLRQYLNENDLPRFALADPAVQESVARIWINSQRLALANSSRLQKTLAEIHQAREILEHMLLPDGSSFRPSPFQTSPALNEALGREIFFLNDTGRPTGSFKERGAVVEALRAGDEGAIQLVTASHGNHGLAVALAAQIFGLRATIVVPETTPRVKIERLLQRGAQVVLTGEQPYRAYEEARDWGLRFMLERNHQLEDLFGIRGAVRYVHGFEDVIPGQGVAGLEILEGIKNLPQETRERLARAVFLIPMGGGGLSAGVATAIRGQFPEARKFGIASDQAPALHHSLLTGQRSEVFLNEMSLCDSGIGLTVPGARPYAILREALDGSFVVSDPLVGEAMRLIHRHHGTMVEGSGATGIAALLSGRLAEFGVEPSAPVVTILTGGNIDISRHRGVLEGKEGRLPGGILDEILSPNPNLPPPWSRPAKHKGP